MRRRRVAIKRGYSLMVRAGMFTEAKLLLMMLRQGKLLLGPDDVSMNVAIYLEDVGCTVMCNRNGSMVASM